MQNIFADLAWFLSHAVLLSISETSVFFPGTKMVISFVFSWKHPLRFHKTNNNMATKRTLMCRDKMQTRHNFKHASNSKFCIQSESRK